MSCLQEALMKLESRRLTEVNRRGTTAITKTFPWDQNGPNEERLVFS